MRFGVAGNVGMEPVWAVSIENVLLWSSIHSPYHGIDHMLPFAVTCPLNGQPPEPCPVHIECGD